MSDTSLLHLPRRLVLTGMGWLAAAVIALGPTPVFAQTSGANPGQFIQKLGDRAIETLADKRVSDQQALEVFRQLLTENFDLTTIGRFVLGRYWNVATPAEQQEYMRLFERMIVEVYAQRFKQYSGETFKVTGSRPEGDRDTIVTSQVLRPNGPPVNVAWRIRNRDGALKIIDVIVENVSMSVTQRSEFASVIEQGNGRFGALIEALRQRIQTAQAPAK